ncbi:MAG TPA: CHASE3 domain-containing protein [Chitinophagaceae bacterium]|nr:CHASE3 domain-containing protein [Chitinophagaceae bacterium]
MEGPFYFMQISLNIKNRWGYGIAFFLLLISYFLIFFIIKTLEKDANSVSHSYAIINNLESIKAEITDAETGVRGYMITNDVGFLKPYNSGSKQVGRLYDELKIHTAANKSYQVKIDSLGKLISNKLAYLSGLITKFQRESSVISDEMILTHESNKDVMDNIRGLIKDLKDNEQALMNVRNSKLKSFFQTMAIMAIISLLITLVTIFYSLITYNREKKAKEAADANTVAYRKELEDRINELNRVNIELSELKSIEKFAATGRIARTIAHEVRNPLTNISLATEQLKETGDPSEETELLLGMIGRSVSRINQLVSDLLNATRTEQLEYTLIDINELLNEALELAQDRMELNHIKVEKYYDKELGEISADKEKIKLAFLNIIVNAVEAMKNDSGILEIRTSRLGDRCVIEFKDNGTGIDDETMQKLFEPYFTSKMKGNGLGLTHTQNIILNHKGSINVRSKVGQGTTFIIMLNLKTENN